MVFRGAVCFFVGVFNLQVLELEMMTVVEMYGTFSLVAFSIWGGLMWAGCFNPKYKRRYPSAPWFFIGLFSALMLGVNTLFGCIDGG